MLTNESNRHLHDKRDDWAQYEAMQEAVKSTGFTNADALYIANLPDPLLGFSHNLEWVTNVSQGFMTEADRLDKPFFLYFPVTAPHTPSVVEALTLFPVTATPAGGVYSPLLPFFFHSSIHREPMFL